MELEERVGALEREVGSLKLEIQRTLVEIRASLPEKQATTIRWHQRAWVLALVNLLIAVALFSNVYLYLPRYAPFDGSPELLMWFRAFWLAVAFIWLLLQLYPLALLLEQEDRRWQGVVLRNGMQFLRARPGSVVVVTLILLVIGLINSFLPAIWLVIVLACLLALLAFGAHNVLDLYVRGRRA